MAACFHNTLPGTISVLSRRLSFTILISCFGNQISRFSTSGGMGLVPDRKENPNFLFQHSVPTRSLRYCAVGTQNLPASAAKDGVRLFCQCVLGSHQSQRYAKYKWPKDISCLLLCFTSLFSNEPVYTHHHHHPHMSYLVNLYR